MPVCEESRPFIVDRKISHFFWYGGVAGEGLRSVGVDPLPSSKSVCSILPLARHLRAGEVFSASTPARGSLLKPAAGQQVQPPIDRQGSYHRQRCEYPEEHSEYALLSLACCRVQGGRYPQ
jgi:hypothetical protein